MGSRPWLSEAAASFREAELDRLADLDVDGLDAELQRLVAEQERHIDDCLVLYAGTNALNPRVAQLLASPLSSRPSLGHPGAKHNRGMGAAEQLEVLAEQVMRRLFACRYAELRVPSGSVANLYAFMATTCPGDRILAFDDAAGGHVTHHEAGAAGLYGLEVGAVPFDADRMDVDLDALRATALRLRPRLIVMAGSMCLHPFDVAGVRDVADEVGAYVLYDAAHMGGLIAGGRFQDPLREGAHLMTGSTYKSFGGPAAGYVLSDDEELASRLDAIAYPGLTANFDLGRAAALALAALDLETHGAAYADAQIENASALADALDEAWIPVLWCARGSTSSQHVAVPAAAYGGGEHAARLLEAAGILTSTIGLPEGSLGLRIGTQELTRRGMGVDEMRAIAELVSRVLAQGEDGAKVQRDVVALRRRFDELRFVRHATVAS